MAKARREPLPDGDLVLAVPDGSSDRPPLRFERVASDAWNLQQGEQTLIQARSEGDGCCRDLHLHRLPGYHSPVPPLSAAEMRAGGNWTHRFASWLEETGQSPLHRGRWMLSARERWAPGIWDSDLVCDWPDATLELLCGGGWHGVLPLRPLSAPDSSRVKALRKHARAGTLAPVLMWWVTFLDGWLLLDGHDRAVAALAEGVPPAGVELAVVPDDADWRETARQVTEAHEERMARVAARPESLNTPHQRRTLERGYADTVSTLAYEHGHTPVFAARTD